MDYVKFCIYQFILFIALIIINIPLDKYISKPFTSIDLIAICISILFILILYRVLNRIYKKFENIELRNKILISIPIFLLSIIFICLIVGT